MKHAFLIIAHHEPYILSILLELLQHEDVYCFVHIDKKCTDISALLKVCNKPNVEVLPDRMDVRWGDFSQIKVEMSLFRKAFETGFDYYHLVSGVDLPIKRVSDILSFFEQNKGKEFITLSLSQFNRKDAYNKMKYYYLFQRYEKDHRKRAKIVHKINAFLLSVQKKFNIDRCKNDNFLIWKSENWISLTHDAVSYIITKEAFVMKRFRNCRCADEIYKSTLLLNSKFKKNLYHLSDVDNRLSNMRLIDWERGTPYTFQDEDFEELIKSPYLFARKFSSKHKDIIDRLKNKLQS